MKVSYECASCMMRQSREAIENAVEDTEKRMDATVKVLSYLEENFKKGVQSNKLGTDLHTMIMNETKNPDPYKQLRENGNRIAQKIVPKIRKHIEENPTLEQYVKAAVVGNIIDFGALEQDTDMEKMIMDNIDKEAVINDTQLLDESLKSATKILYLADNGGEIVFDKLLIEKIKQDYDVEIILAVKKGPILNDALLADAKNLKLDELTTLITTGAASVGIVEDYVSDELKDLMENVDFIISKGMGNYEGLSEMEVNTPIFYLLTTKCNVISKELKVGVKSIVIMKSVN